MAFVAPGLALRNNGVIGTVIRRSTNQLRDFFSQLIPLSCSDRSILDVGVHYFRTKILPGALPTLKAMALMELWRQIWSRSFRLLRRIYHRVFRHRYDESLWKRY